MNLIESIRRGVATICQVGGLCFILLGASMILVPILLGLYLLKFAQTFAGDDMEQPGVVLVPAGA